MHRHRHVWKVMTLASIVLVLLSFNAAAFDADTFKSDMDATFDDKFGDFDSRFDTTSRRSSPSDSSSNTVSRSFSDSYSSSVDNNDNDNSDSSSYSSDDIRTSTTSWLDQWDWADDAQNDNNERRGDETSENRDSDNERDDSTTSLSDSFQFNTDSSTGSGSSDSDSGSDDSDSSSSDSGSIDSGNSDSGSTSAPSSSGSLEDRTEQELHKLINNERRQRGLSPLDWSSGLAGTADEKSDDMARRGYFDHTAPDGDNFRDLYNQNGVNCRLGGENIARTWYNRNVRTDTGSIVHYDSASELADGLRRQWMTSSGHREAILRPYYNNHGLGVEITSGGKVYATEHFC